MTAIFQRLKAFLRQFCQELREEFTPLPDPPKSEYLIDPEKWRCYLRILTLAATVRRDGSFEAGFTATSIAICCSLFRRLNGARECFKG